MPELYVQFEVQKNLEDYNTASIQAVSSFMIIFVFSALRYHRRSAELKRKQWDWNFSRAVSIPTKVKTIYLH
jgi:uncharacterized membrane protein